MEQYFRKYSSEIEALETGHGVSEEAFLSRCASMERKSSVRRRLIALICTAAASAAVIVSIFLPGRETVPGPAELYAQEYTDGIRSILDNIRDMELKSDVCRQMGISSTVDGLLASRHDLEKQLDGLAMDDRMQVLKTYYDRQTECVASLYRDCIRAYTYDMIRNR